MKDRIAKIMQHEAMTAAQFADKIGISPASLSFILNGRNKPSLDVILKIRKKCPYVSSDWLLEGEGEMLSSSSTVSENPSGALLDGFSTDENPFFATEGTDASENRKEIGVNMSLNQPKEVVVKEVKLVEAPAKKITEIRIFFDNGTYETFRPEK